MSDKTNQNESLKERALAYHRLAPAGKLEIQPTKPLATQDDLALAYSPGVAFACEDIVQDPLNARDVTARGNLVGVITNGTAVLGLGNIGPLASKPVMEGKGVLFKKFAGIDVFDVEVDELDPDKFVNTVAALEPTFGAINLEDIKAPECFYIEEELKKRMKIPVFHDDQHGTAIIVASAIYNGLEIVGKKIEEVKLVTSGAGAAALACLDLLVDMGMKVENIWVTDLHGVAYKGRKEEMDPRKERFAKETDARTLDEVIEGADVFLGLSAPRVLKQAMVKKMAAKPLVMALANPTPEILPHEVKEVRDDAIIATGRSDFPNQVNNVLCFPFIFRGALDVGATCINEAMKIACVKAVANLARREQSDVVASAYGDQQMSFGPEYLIPKPFDPRLMTEIAPAVAKAAMESGVATRPIEDFDAYISRLNGFNYKSGQVMRPVFQQAKANPKRVVYGEGENECVLRAVQTAVDDGLVKPILIGRRQVVEARIEKLGLRLKENETFELCDPENDTRYRDYWTHYHGLMERRGVNPEAARTIIRTNTTVIAALMVLRREADAMVVGTVGQYTWHVRHIEDVLGVQDGVTQLSALTGLITPKGPLFICDTHITPDPSAEDLVDMTLRAAEEVRRFGIEPKIALVSHANFGSRNNPTAVKMHKAMEILLEKAPHLEIEGEMHADAALSEKVRLQIFPNSRLKGAANLLVMPSLDAANITYNALKIISDAQPFGPILLGSKHSAHVVTNSATVRGILNISALASVDAQSKQNR